MVSTPLVEAATEENMGRDPAERKKLITASVIAVCSIGLLCYLIFSAVTGGSEGPEALSRKRTVMDSETKEVFLGYAIPEGASFPLVNPKTGKKTLYIAEACYWTKEGKGKREPTWVIFNSYLGKPEPTICPDCGRPVVPHNPKPPDFMK